MGFSKAAKIAELKKCISSMEANPPSAGNSFEHGNGGAEEFASAPFSIPAPLEGEDSKAFSRIESLFMFRDRSEQEMRKRLAAEEFTPASIDKAIEKALRCGIIDDQRFADSFIRGRLSAGKGSCGIEQDLVAKGIDPAALPMWPHGYEQASREAQKERALALLEKQPPRSKNPLRSAYEKLVRKGYSSSIAGDVARLWFNANFR